MEELGARPQGLLMNDLGVDLAVDLAYTRQLHHLRDGKTSDFVESLWGTSFIDTLIQLTKKLPIIAVMIPIFVPLKVMQSIPAVLKANSVEVKQRIDDRGKTKHLDFVDYMIGPDDAPPPKTKQELIHVEQVAFQIFVAGFDPVQITSYAALFFLLRYPKTKEILTRQIRESFKSYEEITPDSLVGLQYLQAFIREIPRTQLIVASGLPRLSPGAMVDGVYVPKGSSLLITPNF